MPLAAKLPKVYLASSKHGYKPRTSAAELVVWTFRFCHERRTVSAARNILSTVLELEVELSRCRSSDFHRDRHDLHVSAAVLVIDDLYVIL